MFTSFCSVPTAKSVDASVVKFTEDFINKMEEWEAKQKNAAATGGIGYFIYLLI